MSEKKQPIKVAIIPLILIVMLITGCSSSKSTSTESGTGFVTETTMTETVESSGSVSAKQIATLAWGTSGNVLEISAATNEQVSSGDVLMRLDSTTAPADVIEAISTLVTAQQELATAKESKTALAEAEVALSDAKDAYYQALGYSYTLGKPVGSDDYNAILRSNVIDAQEVVNDAEDYYAGFGERADSDPQMAQA